MVVVHSSWFPLVLKGPYFSCFFLKKKKILEITWDVCYCFDLRSDSYSLTPQTWQGPHSNFVDCESFLESNSPDILALCETNLDDSIDSGNFSVRGYLPLFGKDSSNHIHGLTVYMMERLPSISSTMAFPLLGNSDHVVSVFIDFPSYAQQDALFHCIAYDYSCADWDSLCDHLRDVPWEDIFKLSASAAASGFKLELMYISLIERIKSSPTYLHGFQLFVLLP